MRNPSNMPPGAGRWAATSLDQDLMDFENAATVRLAATFGLIDCRTDDSIAEVLRREDTQNIDYIPVRHERRVVGVLARERAEKAKRGRVSNVMSSLDSSMFASSSDHLLPVLESLDGEPQFRLVLERGVVQGILTLSDLQKLPVATLLFARLAHFETLLTEVLRRQFGGNGDLFMDQLPAEQRKRCKATWERLRKGEQEIDHFQASYLPDKLHVGAKRGLLPGETGKIDALAKRIQELRNAVAHNNEYAASRGTALGTVCTLRELRQLIAHLRPRLESAG